MPMNAPPILRNITVKPAIIEKNKNHYIKSLKKETLPYLKPNKIPISSSLN